MVNEVVLYACSTVQKGAQKKNSFTAVKRVQKESYHANKNETSVKV